MKIHQLLHGYSEGHKLLASSLSNITPKDRKKVALLSDWDEYATGRDDDSYITCYPLAECNYYAIAKTWYANDMDRPGCVWTHTLLIDCSDDSEFLDLRMLHKYFVKPEAGDFSKYENPIEISASELIEIKNDLLRFDEPSIDYWLQELLYEREPLAFSVEKTATYYQLLVLSILNHLPRALMRRYSMCSGTGRVRKYDNKVFDFQFITSYKSNIPRLSKPIEDGEVVGWCKFVATSIKNGSDSVPRLVSRFSTEIGDNIERYAAVIIVYELLDRLKGPGEHNVSKFNLALRAMAEVFPTPEDGRYFKSVILSQGMSKYFFDEKEFIYQIVSNEYSNSYNYEDFDFRGRIDSYFANHNVREYADLIDELLLKEKKSTYIENVFEKASKPYDDEDIEYLFYNHWPFYLELIKRRPSILGDYVWLNAEGSKFITVLNVFLQQVPCEFTEWTGLINKVIESKQSVGQNFINVVSDHVDSLVGILLSKINSGENLTYEWIDYCKSQPLDVIRWLKTQEEVNVSIVRIVMHAIDPESEMVKNTISDDWRALLATNVGDDLKLEFSVFLFLLSYGTDRKDTSFALYKKSFQPIYEATADDKIGYYWAKIGPYCPKPIWGWEWDKCDMLRKGFADRLFFENRNISEARRFTSNRKVNKKLVKAAAKRFA